jgi:O-antigen ligase
VTLAWSPEVKQGLREVGANRWVWAIVLLWPVMMHRTLLIAALAAGFLCGNMSQLLHAVGQAWSIEWLVWPRLEDRNSGWWDPVVGGTLLVGALGLHLPAAAMGRGLARALGLAGTVVTLLAIVATGTRGAWIAAAGLVVIVAGVAVAMRLRASSRLSIERSGRSERTEGVTRGSSVAKIGTAALVILIAGVVGWVAVGDSALRRIAEARQEVSRAQEGDYETYTGARLLMAQWAARAVREQPMGVGAGGYRAWVHERMRERGAEQLVPYVHGHAHNALLHIGATVGVVGLVLAGMVMLAGLWGGFSHLGPGGLGSYSAGPGFALVGLVLVSMFDVVHLNAQTGALLAGLLGLCLVSRPVERPVPARRG